MSVMTAIGGTPETKKPAEAGLKGKEGAAYNAPMEGLSPHAQYLIWKALALFVIVGVVCFLYGLLTGRRLGQGRSDKEEARKR
jgi:uncharacterized membrane protein